MESNSAPKAYFDFSKLFSTTKAYIDTHNKNNDRLTDRLNANHRATAELITRLYAKQLNHANFPGRRS